MISVDLSYFCDYANFRTGPHCFILQLDVGHPGSEQRIHLSDATVDRGLSVPKLEFKSKLRLLV